MATAQISQSLIKLLDQKKYHFYVVNFACPDMVAHTGNIQAAKQAIAAADTGIGQIATAVLNHQGTLVITADHGNVEQMVDPHTNQALTSHTNGPVPLIYVGGSDMQFQGEGSLSDIAPTLLTLMGIPIPREMTGKMLLVGSDSSAQTQAAVQA